VAQSETVDLDVTFAADAILAAITPPLYDLRRQSRNFSRERILAGMRRLFIDGLRVHSQQTTDTRQTFGGKTSCERPLAALRVT